MSLNNVKVINLFGGPGTGKSTTAAGLFHKMKLAGYKVELITEYAKDQVYQKNFNKMKDQGYLFAKQHHRIWACQDQVDYVIVDSPLLQGLVYFDVEDRNYSYDTFAPYVYNVFMSYFNINIFIRRDVDKHSYQEYGRTQDLDGAKLLDGKIKQLLDNNYVPYRTIQFSDNLVDDIFNIYFKDQS